MKGLILVGMAASANAILRFPKLFHIPPFGNAPDVLGPLINGPDGPSLVAPALLTPQLINNAPALGPVFSRSPSHLAPVLVSLPGLILPEYDNLPALPALPGVLGPAVTFNPGAVPKFVTSPDSIPALLPVMSSGVCGGPDHVGCSVGMYCHIDAGFCDETKYYGICLERPFICEEPDGEAWSVCGCDGMVYVSPCAARLAGQNVRSFSSSCAPGSQPDSGAVQRPVGIIPWSPDSPPPPERILHECMLDGDCGGFAYCQFSTCSTAGATGYCLNVPKFCPPMEELNTVCGCDGYSYDNECEASRARVSIAHRGVCNLYNPARNAFSAPPRPTCGDKSPTGEPGTCKDPRMHCVDSVEGKCGNGTMVCIVPELELPSTCDGYQVLGCDGEIYANQCVAWQYGISVASTIYSPPGQTVPPYQRPPWLSPLAPRESEGECATTDDCPDAYYCLKEEGKCDSVGQCVGTSSKFGCPRTEAPVCGCDGVTYLNSCFAATQGRTSSAGAGLCLDTPEDAPFQNEDWCRDDSDCDQGLFCQIDFADCGAAGSVGKCQRAPVICPGTGMGGVPLESVCGCDHVTYKSVCHAHAARISVTSFDHCSA